MTRSIPLLILISMLAAGCSGQAEKPAAAAQPVRREAYILGAYEGTLPCADCEGIRTELTLESNGRFELRETYLGASGGPEGGRTTITRGRWALLRGTDEDSEAEIYRLTPLPEGEVRYFRDVDPQHLRMLDREQHEIVSGLNYTLTRR